MKNKLSILILAVMLFASCGPTISGKDEQSFKASKAKIEEKLDKKEKEDLEKALSVILVSAMKKKWNNPDDVKYKGKSFDAIVMAMIDGKTFSGIVSYAEDFLKTDKAENIKKAESEIDSLGKDKVKYLAQNKALDNFKLTKISIIEEEFFGKQEPHLEYTFVNNTKSEILGYMIAQDIYSKKTGEKLSSMQSGNRSEIDSSIKDGDGLKSGEEISISESLSSINSQTDAFKNATYPITDFSKLDLDIKVYPALIITRKEKLVRATNLEILDKEIKQLEKELKDLKDSKATLDELELTE